eukprot:scaffold367_cov202-Alexandrium_tamarense.AAC.36
MASINLSAGKKCAALSDHTSAFKALRYRVGTLALRLLDKVNTLAHTWGASIHLGYLSRYYQLQSRTCSAQFQAGSLVIRFPSQPTTGAEIINGTSRTIS